MQRTDDIAFAIAGAPAPDGAAFDRGDRLRALCRSPARPAAWPPRTNKIIHLNTFSPPDSRTRWDVYLRNEDGLEIRHPSETLESAIAVACILLNDKLDVFKIESGDGYTIEAHIIRELCGLQP